MDTRFVLEKQSWAGWLEVPAHHAGWAASPVWITNILPLKTGQGRLAIEYIRPLLPGGGRRQSVELRVIQHGPGHLVGSFKQADGSIGTAILSPISVDWLASYCPLLLDRRPIGMATLPFFGAPSDDDLPNVYLERILGRSETDILCGATASGSGAALQPMPAQSAEFVLDVTYRPFDALMIARGLVPQDMDDRWFVFLADGHLRFHRSWTGALIYDVEAVWRDDQLYLGKVRANRDPGQYRVTDDRFDEASLRNLIKIFLLGLPSSSS